MGLYRDRRTTRGFPKGEKNVSELESAVLAQACWDMDLWAER